MERRKTTIKGYPIKIENYQSKIGPRQNLCKNKFKMFLQIICVIGCSLCFTYQTFQLVTIYLSGDTVVEVRNEKIKYSQIPAVTICLPTLIDMRRFFEVYRDNTKIEGLEEAHKTYQTLESLPIEKWNQTDHQEHNQLHLKMFELFHQAKVNLSDVFDKVSIRDINLNPLYFEGYQSPVDIDSVLTAFDESGELGEIPLPKVVRSMLPWRNPRECFTYFSDFDDNYWKTKWKVFEIVMVFQPDRMVIPKEEERNIVFTLHSPNILPEYLFEYQFRKLKLGVQNLITYSESQTVLLPPPYKTNCKHYPINSTGEQNMRSDCINQCVNDKLEKEFQLGCVW